MTLHQIPLPDVRLERGLFDTRRRLNREYLAELKPDALLQNHYIEAGVGSQQWHLHPSRDAARDRGLDRHWGWETPGSLLRGHFVGHWMSAVAREVAVTGDGALRAQLDAVLDGLERCQRESDGEWVWAIPPSFLRRLDEGQSVWAPQYNMHKTLMGLVDVWRDLRDERALVLAVRATQPLLRWVRDHDDESFQRVLEVETGGMLEVWADLLEVTEDPIYRELLDRYYRRWLFDGLLEGRDVLTNMHANTTIPEVLGAARAYEVTGDDIWRRIVEAYWDWAVVRRGTFCTGGQTSGEIWTPPFAFASRRGEKTQEHCSVYNMIRLADTLLRWTGDLAYADYIERNLYNGILAQQHPATGMVAYFLPLVGGSRKEWGSPTEDFWCCHGSLVQAHTRHAQLVFYTGDDDTLTIAQFIAARAIVQIAGGTVEARLERLDEADDVGPDANAGAAGDRHRPMRTRIRVTVNAPAPIRVRIRVPEWVDGQPETSADNQVTREGDALVLAHPGGRVSVDVSFGYVLRTLTIPDEPSTVAFVEGPIVLAGVVDREVSLSGDVARANELLVPDDERHWTQWRSRYRAVRQPVTTRFRPLYEIADEPFAVYFPVVGAF